MNTTDRVAEMRSDEVPKDPSSWRDKIKGRRRLLQILGMVVVIVVLFLSIVWMTGMFNPDWSNEVKVVISDNGSWSGYILYTTGSCYYPSKILVNGTGDRAYIFEKGPKYEESPVYVYIDAHKTDNGNGTLVVMIEVEKIDDGFQWLEPKMSDQTTGPNATVSAIYYNYVC